MNDYVNPANAITASRFFTLPPFLYCIEHGYYQWATVLIITCGGLDMVDGYVARLFKCTSGFGELFDAITDLLCYGFFIGVQTVYGWIPWPPVAIIATLAGANAIMRVIYSRRAGRATNYRSYAMERLAAFAGYAGGVGANQIEVEFYFYACAILMTIVVIHDTKRMLIDPIPPPPERPADPGTNESSEPVPA